MYTKEAQKKARYVQMVRVTCSIYIHLQRTPAKMPCTRHIYEAKLHTYECMLPSDLNC